MRHIYLVCFLLIISLSVIAQSQEQKQVTDAVEKLRKAMIAADRATLENITSDSLSYGHSSGKIENKTAFIESIITGRSAFVTIDISEQTISISHDVAIVRHTLTAATNDSGKPGNVKLKVLLIWQKEKGMWKLLARQAVKQVSPF